MNRSHHIHIMLNIILQGSYFVCVSLLHLFTCAHAVINNFVYLIKEWNMIILMIYQ